MPWLDILSSRSMTAVFTRGLSLLGLIVFLIAASAPEARAVDFPIKAKQAILIDADSGAVLFQKNADDLMYPASMSKIMALAVIFKALKAGTLKLDEPILMSENAWRKGGGVSYTSAMMVPVNTREKLEQLILGIIVQSGNDASIAIAEAIAGSEEAFARMMEEEARRIGLTKSTFRNSIGLFHPEHKMTARELALLARHLVIQFPEYYPWFSQREFLYRKHRFFNRNPLLGLPIGVDGIKTGHIKEAGFGIVVSAKQDNRRIILVINGHERADERKAEAVKILEWGFRSFGEFKLFEAGEVVGQARVWGGTRMYVPLSGLNGGAVAVVLPRFPAGQKLKAELIYKGPLKPPLKKGDAVATLRVTSSSGATAETPLYAAEDVEPAGMVRRGFDSMMMMAFRWMM
ncbi:MAG TPA: D-alanyl-D-alanine carboxypeptidase family protein [Hyphomicrobiaceae bacterium]|nr:D-alanyl-D-alanine carboxypeptidase family protein [Hyphomicrobiaceae bacterium]